MGGVDSEQGPEQIRLQGAVEGEPGEWQGEGEMSFSGSSPEQPCVSPKAMLDRRMGTRMGPWGKRPLRGSEEVDKSLPRSLNRGSN